MSDKNTTGRKPGHNASPNGFVASPPIKPMVPTSAPAKFPDGTLVTRENRGFEGGEWEAQHAKFSEAIADRASSPIAEPKKIGDAVINHSRDGTEKLVRYRESDNAPWIGQNLLTYNWSDLTNPTLAQDERLDNVAVKAIEIAVTLANIEKVKELIKETDEKADKTFNKIKTDLQAKVDETSEARDEAVERITNLSYANLNSLFELFEEGKDATILDKVMLEACNKLLQEAHDKTESLKSMPRNALVFLENQLAELEGKSTLVAEESS